MTTDTSDFGTFGRFVETPVGEMSPDMREAYAFTRELRGLVPGPHKIWLAKPTLSKTMRPPRIPRTQRRSWSADWNNARSATSPSRG